MGYRRGWQQGYTLEPKYRQHQGLTARYTALKPDATKGIDVCLFFEQHEGEMFTAQELAHHVGCSVSLVTTVVRVLGSLLDVGRGRPPIYGYRVMAHAEPLQRLLEHNRDYRPGERMESE